MKKIELARVLGPAMMQWPHITVTEGLASLWFAAFHEVDLKAFETAVMHVLLHKKDTFPLNISEVNEALEQLTEIEGEQLTVEEAWDKARYCARRWGVHHRVKAIAYCQPWKRLIATIRDVGYERICNCTDKDRVYVRRDFEEAWACARKRETLSEHRMLTTNRRMLNEKAND